MHRLQAFEFHERPECPRVLREGLVETLGHGLRLTTLYETVAPVVAAFAADAGGEVLDLCSGSGEPVAALLDALARRGLPAPRVLLSDLFPHATALAAVAARHPGRVDWVPTPVDATDVPPTVDRPGRMVINAFHHFPPPLAARILGDAVAKRRAMLIVEAFPPRDVAGFLAVAPALALAGMLNPLRTERERLLKFLATFVVPVMPVLGAWDGIVSSLRGYDEPALRALAGTSDAYRWEYREVPFVPFGRAVVFQGRSLA